jgi:hypothetical protein
MRPVLFAIAACLLSASVVAAQESPSTPELTRASRALAAIWRPLPGEITQAAVESACAGALEEMAAVEAALPPVLTAESLARVRALRGLLIVPAGDAPGEAYFFPPPNLAWFASGIGRISVISEADGFIAVRDAEGRDIALQLGRAGRTAMLRLRPPEGEPIAFVGCAPVG